MFFFLEVSAVFRLLEVVPLAAPAAAISLINLVVIVRERVVITVWLNCAIQQLVMRH